MFKEKVMQIILKIFEMQKLILTCTCCC